MTTTLRWIFSGLQAHTLSDVTLQAKYHITGFAGGDAVIPVLLWVILARTLVGNRKLTAARALYYGSVVGFQSVQQTSICHVLCRFLGERHSSYACYYSAHASACSQARHTAAPLGRESY